jgi:hypothetical protein
MYSDNIKVLLSSIGDSVTHKRRNICRHDVRCEKSPIARGSNEKPIYKNQKF